MSSSASLEHPELPGFLARILPLFHLRSCGSLQSHSILPDPLDPILPDSLHLAPRHLHIQLFRMPREVAPSVILDFVLQVAAPPLFLQSLLYLHLHPDFHGLLSHRLPCCFVEMILSSRPATFCRLGERGLRSLCENFRLIETPHVGCMLVCVLLLLLFFYCLECLLNVRD